MRIAVLLWRNGRKTDQIVDNRTYKQFVRRFKQASDPASLSSVANDWFDAGGSAEETIDDRTLFGRILATGDGALIERALTTLTPFRSRLAIGEAAAAGKADLLRRVIELGASVGVSEHFQHHVSHVAVAACNHAPACLDVLLEAGLTVDDRDSDGRTPLHFASMTGDSRAVQLLLERGADVDAQVEGADERRRHRARAERQADQTACLSDADFQVESDWARQHDWYAAALKALEDTR